MHIDDYTKDYPKDEPRITDVRYFYEKSLMDIPLDGYRKGSVYTFYFNLNEQSFQERFVLVKDQNGQVRQANNFPLF